MKKSILYTLSLLLAVSAFFACEKQNIPDPQRLQHPDEQSPIVRDDAYYARLRAYKQTPHKLAFGWYGSWTAIASSEQSRLRSAPDSMDIISIWSQWHSLSQAQMADKEFVQKVLGTKVVFCISGKDVPAVFKEGGTEDGEITEESLVAYAKAWGKDSMDKYQYDGMDIDFETASDHLGPLNKQPEKFRRFCQELSKYIGPKSGTGRLFLIDGNIDSGSLLEGIAELCNYGVSQAYSNYGNIDKNELVRRTNSAATRGWKADQLMFTENFEALWQTGGKDYTCSDGVVRPTLLGMADFAKTSDAIGFGSYHMEYEYGHSDMPYKYIRRAIQLANPAPAGDYTKNLLTINETNDQTFTVTALISGEVIGDKVTTTFTADLSSFVSAETQIELQVDNSLVAAYNDYYYADYKTLDPSMVNFSEALHFAANTKTTDNKVTAMIADADLVALESGEYLIPINAKLDPESGFSVNTNKKVKYIILIKKDFDGTILPGATSIDGNVISDMTGWVYNVEGEGTQAMGGDALTTMFDGNNTAMGWYSSVEGNREVRVDMAKSQTIIGWRMGMVLGSPQYATLKLYNISTSSDNVTWVRHKALSDAVEISAPDANKWQYVKFVSPVTCRYIRMTYKQAAGSASGGFIGCNEFNAIAPKN